MEKIMGTQLVSCSVTLQEEQKNNFTGWPWVILERDSYLWPQTGMQHAIAEGGEFLAAIFFFFWAGKFTFYFQKDNCRHFWESEVGVVGHSLTLYPKKGILSRPGHTNTVMCTRFCIAVFWASKILFGGHTKCDIYIASHLFAFAERKTIATRCRITLVWPDLKGYTLLMHAIANVWSFPKTRL